MNYNVFIENEYQDWDVDIESVETSVQKIFDYYMTCPEIADNCCLQGYEYNSVAFDILFTDSKKTHQINKEYRHKDYPADIITFAVFADSSVNERFVLDLEINLGEIIIGLDKIIEESEKKEVSKEIELVFMIMKTLRWEGRRWLYDSNYYYFTYNTSSMFFFRGIFFRT